MTDSSQYTKNKNLGADSPSPLCDYWYNDHNNDHGPYVMLPNRIVWFDTESTGIDTQLDQILQLAYVVTDNDLNEVPGGRGEMLSKIRPDVIPHPKAFLTHRLDPRELRKQPLTEYQLLSQARSMFMAMGGTCIAGYNSISFDHDIMRHSLYRNMRDAYDYEWKDGNFKVDIYKLVLLAQAYCPDTLEWPVDDAGQRSLRLERLAPANGMEGMNAHDALSDVLATIHVARKIKEANPKLWSYFLSLSSKSFISSMLLKREPVLVTDTFLGRHNAYTSMVYPVCTDSQVDTKFLCLDLREDPEPVLSMSVEEIRKYAFTKREELPENSPLIPVISIASNKQPLVCEPSAILTAAAAERFNLDVDLCAKRAAMIERDVSFRERLRKAYTSDFPALKNPGRSLYTSAFPDRKQRAVFDSMHARGTAENPAKRIHTESAFDLAMKLGAPETIQRFFPLILRTKMTEVIRDYLKPDINPMQAAELAEYVIYMKGLLDHGFDPRDRTMDDFRKECNKARMEVVVTEEDESLLVELEGHMEQVNSLIQDLYKKIHTPAFTELLGQSHQESPAVRALMSTDCKKIAGIELEKHQNNQMDSSPSP